MTPDQIARAVVLLEAGTPLREVAEAIGVPCGTLMTQISRARHGGQSEARPLVSAIERAKTHAAEARVEDEQAKRVRLEAAAKARREKADAKTATAAARPVPPYKLREAVQNAVGAVREVLGEEAPRVVLPAAVREFIHTPADVAARDAIALAVLVDVDQRVQTESGASMNWTSS